MTDPKNKPYVPATPEDAKWGHSDVSVKPEGTSGAARIKSATEQAEQYFPLSLVGKSPQDAFTNMTIGLGHAFQDTPFGKGFTRATLEMGPATVGELMISQGEAAQEQSGKTITDRAQQFGQGYSEMGDALADFSEDFTSPAALFDIARSGGIVNYMTARGKENLKRTADFVAGSIKANQAAIGGVGGAIAEHTEFDEMSIAAGRKIKSLTQKIIETSGLDEQYRAKLDQVMNVAGGAFGSVSFGIGMSMLMAPEAAALAVPAYFGLVQKADDYEEMTRTANVQDIETGEVKQVRVEVLKDMFDAGIDGRSVTQDAVSKDGKFKVTRAPMSAEEADAISWMDAVPAAAIEFFSFHGIMKGINTLRPSRRLMYMATKEAWERSMAKASVAAKAWGIESLNQAVQEGSQQLTSEYVAMEFWDRQYADGDSPLKRVAVATMAGFLMGVTFGGISTMALWRSAKWKLMFEEGKTEEEADAIMTSIRDRVWAVSSEQAPMLLAEILGNHGKPSETGEVRLQGPVTAANATEEATSDEVLAQWLILKDLLPNDIRLVFADIIMNGKDDKDGFNALYAPIQELILLTRRKWHNTVPHEVFHAFWDKILTQKQRDELLNEVFLSTGESDPLTAEEWLSDRFADSFLNRQSLQKTATGRAENMIKGLVGLMKKFMSLEDSGTVADILRLKALKVKLQTGEALTEQEQSDLDVLQDLVGEQNLAETVFDEFQSGKFNAGKPNARKINPNADTDKEAKFQSPLVTPVDGLGLYSALHATVAAKMPAKAPVDMVRNILKSQGVKQEEIDWVGVEQFLDGKTTVDRKELLDFIESHDLPLQENVRGGPVGPSKEMLQEKVESLHEQLSGEHDLRITHFHGDTQITKISTDEDVEYDDLHPVDKKVVDEYEAAKDALEAPDKSDQSLFGTLVLPGGENYREILHTLPADKVPITWLVEKLPENQSMGPAQRRWVVRASNEKLHHRSYSSETEARVAAKILNQGNQKDYPANVFRSGHYPEVQLLVHSRVNDRYTVLGKTLFIEEIQKDRDNALLQIHSELAKTTDQDERTKLLAEIKALEEIMPMPYVAHEVMLKRLLRYAAENGYDAIAWTTGQQQADRYDMSKQIDTLGYLKYEQDGQNFYNIRAGQNKVEKVSKTRIPESKLADVVGKELASKMIAGEHTEKVNIANTPLLIDRRPIGERPSEIWNVLSGLDLKVGGEGKKKFYDEVVPQFLKKYTKKWGGQVQDIQIVAGTRGAFTATAPIKALLKSMDDLGFDSSSEAARSVLTHDDYAQRWDITDPAAIATLDAWRLEQRGDNVHALAITPPMRESVMTGQPKFQANKKAADVTPQSTAKESAADSTDAMGNVIAYVQNIFDNAKPYERSPSQNGTSIKQLSKALGISDAKARSILEKAVGQGYLRKTLVKGTRIKLSGGMGGYEKSRYTGEQYFYTPTDKQYEKLAAADIKPQSAQQKTDDGFAALKSRYSNIEMVPISELIKYREDDRRLNPKDSNTPKNIEDLKESILKDGFTEPLSLNYYQRDNTAMFMEGNHRINAAIELGMTHVPVHVRRIESFGGQSTRKKIQSIRGAIPNQHGYVPGDLKPSDVGMKTVVPDNDVRFQTADTPETVSTISSEAVSLANQFGINVGLARKRLTNTATAGELTAIRKAIPESQISTFNRKVEEAQFRINQMRGDVKFQSKTPKVYTDERTDLKNILVAKYGQTIPIYHASRNADLDPTKDTLKSSWINRAQIDGLYFTIGQPANYGDNVVRYDVPVDFLVDNAESDIEDAGDIDNPKFQQIYGVNADNYDVSARSLTSWMNQLGGNPAGMQIVFQDFSGEEKPFIMPRKYFTRAFTSFKDAMKDASGVKFQSHEKLISTRVPSAKKGAVENPRETRLTTGLDAMKKGREAFEKNIDLMSKYSNFRLTGVKGADAKAEAMIEHMVENLLWLHDKMRPELRDLAKQWYVGANRLVNRWAKTYNLKEEQVAGVIAVLSPQQDWFTNISLAERVLDAMHEQSNFKWTQAMTDTAKRIYQQPQHLAAMPHAKGKTLGEVTLPLAAAMWIRVYDETYNTRDYRVLVPDGVFAEYKTKIEGGRSKVRWGSNHPIAKAWSIIKDGSHENLFIKMGSEHKVRSFYNNMLAPFDSLGDVTSDTHAVGAGLFRIMSGTTMEVEHNFGTGVGSSSSVQSGMSGTYGVYSEAYRRAAALRDLLPREMQSITWEAVRGLFRPSYKGNVANVKFVEGQWAQYKTGKKSRNEVREAIYEHAKGITDPDWVGFDSGLYEKYGDSSYKAELPGAGLAGGNSDGAGRGVSGTDTQGTEVRFQSAAGRVLAYHGTTGGFNLSESFSGLGMHFGTEEQANRVIDLAYENNDVDPKTGIGNDGYKYRRNLVQVALDLKNPVTLTDPGTHTWDARDVLKELKARGYIEPSAVIEVKHEEDYSQIVPALKQRGYDGVVYDNVYEGTGKSYIVFDKSQIHRVMKPAKFQKRAATKALDAVGKVVDNLFVPISTQLGEIDESLRHVIRRFDFDVNTKTAKDLLKVEPFLKKVVALHKDIYDDLDLALKNRDIATIDRITKTHGIDKEYQAVRSLLDDIHARAKDVEIDVRYMQDYFPRRVSDYDEFFSYLKGTDDWSAIDKAIKEAEKEIGAKMDDEERATFINTIIRGYGESQLKMTSPGNIKGRKISQVTKEMNEFYKPSTSTLVDYVTAMNNLIEQRKLFGKEEATVDESIGAYVDALVHSGQLSISDERRAKELFKQRFTKKSMYDAIAVFKNLSYIYTMGSPISALTQLSDLGFVFYKNGFFRSVGPLVKAAAGKTTVAKEELGLERIAEEFADRRKSSKAVADVFRLIGLNWMDSLGKNTLIQAALDRYQQRAKSNPTKLSVELTPIFGADTSQVIADLQNGVISDDVRYLLFSEVADFQPVTMSEMPPNYASGGNRKIFYMLKSYTIKQFDVYHREIFKKFDTDPVQAIKNLMRLAFSMALMGMASDALKDLILGRKVTLTDRVVENMLKLMGLSRWQIYSAKRDGAVRTMLETILPPVPLIDDLWRDIRGTKNRRTGQQEMTPLPKWRTLGRIPVVGKLYYWWWGGGADISDGGSGYKPRVRRG